MSKKILPQLLCCNFLLVQSPDQRIIVPQKDSVISNENLFVSVALTNYSLDNNTITGNFKISGGNLNFLLCDTLIDTRHQLSIKTFIKSLNKTVAINCTFYVNVRKAEVETGNLKSATNSTPKNDGWVLQGNLMI